eukprot:1199258-Pleurochrysis_carterae.AAC.1
MTKGDRLTGASGQQACVPGPYPRSPSWPAVHRAYSSRRCGRPAHGWCDLGPGQGGPPSAYNLSSWQHSEHRSAR